MNLGSVIFVSNEINAIRKEWSLSSYEPRVALTFAEKTYQVVLLSAVDLDVTNVNYNNRITKSCSPSTRTTMNELVCYSFKNNYQVMLLTHITHILTKYLKFYVAGT